MIIPAVNSVTFRALNPGDVLKETSRLQVPVIEWSGDTHVPPGDLERARQVRALSEKAGVSIVGYGSYHQCDRGGPAKGPFAFDQGAAAAVETAAVLGSPGVRVWAGRQASAAAGAEYRAEVTACLKETCAMAEGAGISVHLEFHRNTLTDTPESAIELLQAVDSPVLRCYWQPRHGIADAECLRDLNLLAPYLSHLHVFHWRLGDAGIERLPLHLGRERWQRFLTASETDQVRYAMIEFVAGDTLQQFEEDWQVLLELTEAIS